MFYYGDIMITKKEFDILCALERVGRTSSQRKLAKEAGMSLGSVNKLLSELQMSGLVENGAITERGLAELEPYRVKRAVIIAAGFGSRLVPITLNTPKPLIRVNGVRIIDTIIDSLLAAEIEEIHIVRGYLSEQFDQLLYKYPNLKFTENPDYNEANNISSIMCVRELLAGAYVIEADLLISHPAAVIRKYQYCTNFIGVPVERTEDWCFKTKGGFITGLSVGGTDCYHMFGISYWSPDDGLRLAKCVEECYNAPGGKERFWDQVPLQFFIHEFRVALRQCSFDDLTEIDTLRELRSLDPAYR